LIHFLLGANVDKSSLFATEALKPYFFRMEFDLGQAQRQVERTGKVPNKIILQGVHTEDWPTESSNNTLFGTIDLPNVQWREVLGKLMFDLMESDEESHASKFSPTFRSLFSYFVRRQSAGGFISPIKQATYQQLWDQQVSISYLLRLDWTIPQQWQRVRERERSLKELKKAADEGTLGAIIGKTAELRTRLTLAEDRTRQLREHVERFEILPEYRILEQEADQLTGELGTLADENTIDRLLLSELQEALNQEADPSTNDLERLYEEAGIILSNSVVRRFEEVKLFHESVIANRRSYLGSEVIAARQRIKVREEQMPGINNRRAKIMAILQSHRALDQLTKLQAELSTQEVRTELIRQRFTAAEQLESEKSELEFERNQLELRLRRDYHEQGVLLRDAILAFEKISRALYEEAGVFTIDASSNGPLFDVTILGQKSKGISNMQIFCFDMMLMKLCAERQIGPGFLVHDSHLFDGVDERQIAKALQLGEKEARDLNFQYIVTMNSDTVPKEFPNDFDLNKYILPIHLTDATEDGGLFGIRF
jgi:uncharacterized protein YydD (DUF2326 family)